MFKEWTKLVQELNKNRNRTNLEKAKKLKNKYMIRGRILKVLGILFIIASVGSFITFSIVDITGDDVINMVIVLVSSFLFPLSAALIGIGVIHKRLAKRLDYFENQPYNDDFLAGNVNNLNFIVNDNNKCPNCGNFISVNKLFCPNCGTKLEKICKKCGSSNEIKNNFCEYCGSDLN